MHIWGLQKISFVDYPEKIAAVCFTVGCNLQCRYCYNDGFVLPDRCAKTPKIAEDDILHFLKQRQGLLDGVVICGGEPLLQTDLLPFLHKIKNLWFALKLDTNGFLPKQLKTTLASWLIDYVAMDIKYDLARLGELLLTKQKAHPFLESLQQLRTGDIPFELRTTVIHGYHTPEVMQSLCALIAGAPRYVLQNFFPTTSMVDPHFDGKSCPKEELETLANIVRPHVGTCVVRY